MTTPDGWVLVPIEPDEAMVVAGIAERHGQPVPEAWSLATANIYRAMLAAAPPPPAGEGWRPIETAPRDGTWVDILTASSGRIADVRWVNEDPTYHLAMSGWKTRENDQRSRLEEAHFTHWMPLPPPPAESEAT